ncbi:MAG TPA: tetratricopeptide repeat protein [Bacteroidia bacterium]|nr:tetratricopeptide repeat protein [Bacteroidia bacterium]
MNFKNEELLDNADLLIKDGKINDAIDVLNEILADDPLFGKAHNHLGYIYETKIRDYAKAEEHYKICLKTNPEYGAVYYNAAILFSTLKKFDELKDLLTKAESVPGINKATINNEWAIMYEAQGDFDKAIQYYRNVITQTYDNKTLDIAMESVRRCEKKKNFLSGNTDSTMNTVNSGKPPADLPPGM